MRIVATLALSVLLAPSARAQCPVLEVPRGYGAVTSGRAVHGIAGAPPRVDFYAKTPTGWQADGSAILGDATYVWPVVVAIDGNFAVAGASEATDAHALQGRAFVYERTGAGWSSQELASGAIEDFAFFGASVALRGDVAAVGATHYYGDNHPRTHVFERTGGAWIETAILPLQGELAIDGDTLVVGIANGPSSVEVFRKVGGSWIPAQTLEGRPGAFSGSFGHSVALRDGRLAVGGEWWSGTEYRNYVVVYRDEAGTFVLAQTLVSESPDARDGFGTSLALSSSTLLVGAPGNVPPHRFGAVHRFEDDGSQFVPAGVLATDALGVLFGDRLAVDGEDAMVAAQGSTAIFRMGFEHVVPYCPTTPNSSGARGALAVEGCDSLSGARFTLVASDLPPGVLARAFFGARATQVPFGDGFRCVGLPLFRFTGGRVDSNGTFAHEVDFTSDPAPHLAAGSTWNFQVLHRDRAGTGINLTNALTIGITP